MTGFLQSNNATPSGNVIKLREQPFIMAFVGAGLAPALIAYEVARIFENVNKIVYVIRCNRAGASPAPTNALISISPLS